MTWEQNRIINNISMDYSTHTHTNTLQHPFRLTPLLWNVTCTSAYVSWYSSTISNNKHNINPQSLIVTGRSTNERSKSTARIFFSFSIETTIYTQCTVHRTKLKKYKHFKDLSSQHTFRQCWNERMAMVEETNDDQVNERIIALNAIYYPCSKAAC